MAYSLGPPLNFGAILFPASTKLKRGRGKRYSGSAAFLFLLPATLLFVVFVAYPILWVIGKSLYVHQANGSDTSAASPTTSTSSAIRFFWIVARNMFLWGLITIPVQMLIGGTIAYFIERHTFRWRGFFRTMYFLPVVTSVSVVSLVWIQIYAPYYGIAQEYLSAHRDRHDVVPDR